MDRDLMALAAPMAAEMARAHMANGIDPTDQEMLRGCFIRAYRAVEAAGQEMQAEVMAKNVSPSPLISAPVDLPVETA